MAKGQHGQFLEVGIVVRVHGVKGKIKVKTYSGETDGLSCVKTIYFQPEGLVKVFPNKKTREGMLPFEVDLFQRLKTHALLTLKDVQDVNTAAFFVNRKVFIHKEDLPELGDEEYYYFELEGFRVVDESGDIVGEVIRVLPSPAHDLLVVLTDDGEKLVPFVEEFVPRVLREERKIVISPIKGLLDDEI